MDGRTLLIVGLILLLCAMTVLYDRERRKNELPAFNAGLFLLP